MMNRFGEDMFGVRSYRKGGTIRKSKVARLHRGEKAVRAKKSRKGGRK